ncbi:hypothetical protein BCR35DRAFT_326932, partial [Leucosporidium creatinivorum]
MSLLLLSQRLQHPRSSCSRITQTRARSSRSPSPPAFVKLLPPLSLPCSSLLMSYRTAAASSSSLNSRRSIDAPSSLSSSADNSEDEAEQDLYASRRERARRRMLARAQTSTGDAGAPLLTEFSPRKHSRRREEKEDTDDSATSSDDDGSSSASEDGPPPPPRRKKTNWLLWIGVAIVAILILAGAAYYFYSDSSSTSSSATPTSAAAATAATATPTATKAATSAADESSGAASHAASLADGASGSATKTATSTKASGTVAESSGGSTSEGGSIATGDSPTATKDSTGEAGGALDTSGVTLTGSYADTADYTVGTGQAGYTQGPSSTVALTQGFTWPAATASATQGVIYLGDVSWYYAGDGGLGSCGKPLYDGQDIYFAALSLYEWMGAPGPSTHCGECLSIQALDTGVTITAIVLDSCQACNFARDDLEQAAYLKLGTLDAGLASVAWEFIDCPSDYSDEALAAL